MVLTEEIDPVDGVRRPKMKRVLGWLELTGIGIGCTIGAGIFVVTGIVAHDKTGPALFLSYILSGLACFFAAFSYAELAAMVPSAGSAYSYARATMGQLMGWILGWDLILEYAVSAASVAQGWSKYFGELLSFMGLHLPPAIMSPPWGFDPDTGALSSTGAVLDLPALLIVVIVTVILVVGIRESARFNTAMVILKLLIVVFVIFVGLAYVKSENFTPFLPYGFGGLSFFGFTVAGQTGPDGSPAGVVAGAALVYFSYIGFDAVVCNSEETKKPQRDLPIAIILSLAVSTVLYVAVSLVLTGMVPYNRISKDAPLSAAFGEHGLRWAEVIIAIGAVVGITSVLLVTMMSQPRIFMAMARDGLLPKRFFAEIHPVFHTPWKSTILTGVFVALISALIPLSVLVELVSIGTLMAFAVVCIAVIVLRKTRPDIPRPFQCPWVPWLPGAGAFLCVMLMLSLPGQNWLRLIVWLLIGLTVYYFYGRIHGHAPYAFSLEQRQQHTDSDSLAAGDLELSLPSGSGIEGKGSEPPELPPLAAAAAAAAAASLLSSPSSSSSLSDGDGEAGVGLCSSSGGSSESSSSSSDDDSQGGGAVVEIAPTDESSSDEESEDRTRETGVLVR